MFLIIVQRNMQWNGIISTLIEFMRSNLVLWINAFRNTLAQTESYQRYERESLGTG